MDPQRIRNFSVIAHIDHGKSTLADRFLELTGALQMREMEAQVLDAMDLERERGITIKAHPVRLHYTADDGEKYVLNLIDTPGHVDSSYDPYRGVVIVIRVIDGTIRPGMKIRLMAQGQDYETLQLGTFTPKAIDADALGVGEVGFLVANIKNVGDAKIGDTITESGNPTAEPFPGFKELKPMVFAGLYPVEGSEYPELRDALEKLRLNDASFFFEPETSAALGFGFRCGFLGLLHMEIVQERLEREFDMDLVTTAPGVLDRVQTTG